MIKIYKNFKIKNFHKNSIILIGTFDGIHSSSTNSMFVDVEVTRTFVDTDTNQEASDTTGDLLQRFIAFRGYGEIADGINPELSKDILITNRNIFVKEGETANIPVFAEETSEIEYFSDETITQEFYYKGDVDKISIDKTDIKIDKVEDPYSIDLTHIKGEDISGASSDFAVSDETTKIRITKRDGTTEDINVFKIEECKHTPYRITFVNKFGALQDLWFFKKRTDDFNVSKESFKRSIVSIGETATAYNKNEHTTKFLDMVATESFKLNTGFVTEDHNEVIKQLLATEYCWIMQSGEAVPIHPKSSSFTEKTSVNDKLMNFEVSFETSSNYIQGIR